MDPQLYRAAAYYDGTSFESFAMDADPTILPKETPQRNAILHVAALNKQAQIAEKILQLHSSLLYHKKSDGDTPFHIAARVGCLEIVQLLLNYGKSGSGEIEANQKATRMVNLTKDTVLHEAARNGNVDVVELLMEEDPGLALLVNAVGESPLSVAVERQFFDIVQRSLKLTDECCYGGRDGKRLARSCSLLAQR
ncbi:uncharacterized protein LOC107412134 [Ziziphus jujuba]|uniref:Uncharacterized protein LOC107412134 n=1 Tax=Ziziphus jujuba TaxID=326968 RepID=A0ABM3ZU54_ZIZJJ|nr:uncharacterized protein LOC107412134 [Ziziphus jujuba]